MHIFTKSHFLHSMLKGYDNELKSNALGRRRGLENRSNLDADAHRKSMHKLMDFEVKIEENREKNGSPNNAFFDHVFLPISGGFGKGLGKVLGGVWRVLAPPGPSLGHPFSLLLFGMGSGRAPGASGARFWMDFEGLGRGPRGVLEANLGVLEGMVSPTIIFLMRFSYRFGKALKDRKC